MRFPLADYAWPPGPRVAAAHDSGIDGRGVGARKALCKPHLVLSETKLSLPPGSAGSTGTKLSQHTSSCRDSAKKFAQHNPSTSIFAKKFAQQAIKRHFWGIYRALGELFRVHARSGPSRENFIPHAGPLPAQNCPHSWSRRAIAEENYPGTHPRRAQPVHNSPSTPQNADFGPFCASRENFVPLPPPTTRSERKKSRTNTPPPHQRAPLHISHAIQLHELSTKLRNVAIPTT